MPGIAKTITKGGFDLSLWLPKKGDFNGFSQKMNVVFYGYKNQAAYESGQSHFRGGEIQKTFDWSTYDGTDLRQWVCARALDPVWDDAEQIIDKNPFKDGIIVG